MSEGEQELDTGDDKELFNAAMGPETVETPASDPPNETTEQKSVGDNRDPETGRFVSKQAEAKSEQKPVEQKEAAAPAQQQEQDSADRIPAWRLREEAEAKREAIARAETAQRQYEETQRQLRELQQRFQQATQKPVEIPDPLQDPSAYTDHFQKALEQKTKALELNMSLNLAARFHKDVFSQAFENFEASVQRGDRALYQRVMASTDPGEAIVQWHREQETLREIGTDPQAFRKKAFTEGLTQKENESILVEAIKQNPELLGKLIAEAQGQAAANAKGPNNNSITKLPSLNRQTSAAPNVLDGGDMSDKELLASVLAR